MPPDRKITIIAAIACVLASVVLAPLFIGALWFVIATGAVITTAGTGTLTRLRPLPVPACLAAGLAGLVLYFNLIFETRHSLLFVIPTPGSLTRLWDLAGTGIHEANVYTAPAQDLPGLLLLAAGGIGITAVLADLIAVRLRFTALTGLPLLVLPSVPVMMNAGHDLFVTGLVFCLGAAGYLATLAAADRASADAAALAMAVPVGLTGIALALCSPLLLPAVSLGQLFSPGASTGTLTQTMAQLHESRPTVVFSYTTSSAEAAAQRPAVLPAVRIRHPGRRGLTDSQNRCGSRPAPPRPPTSRPLPDSSTVIEAARPSQLASQLTRSVILAGSARI